MIDKRVIHYKLVELAKARRTLSYEDLCLEIGYSADIPTLLKALPQILDSITRESYNSSKILLSCLIVSKNYFLPGEGFFVTCTEMELLSANANDQEKVDFFLRALQSAYNYWVYDRAPI